MVLPVDGRSGSFHKLWLPRERVTVWEPTPRR